MATKTSSKTATRKPAAARGAPAARKPATAAAKTKLPKQKLKDDVAPAVKPTPPDSKPASDTGRSSSREAESISLIDRKIPRKKAEDGEVKPKRAVLPPISRIRCSLEPPPAQRAAARSEERRVGKGRRARSAARVASR